MRLKTSKTCPFGHLYSYVGNKRTLAVASERLASGKPPPVTEVALRTRPPARASTRELATRPFAVAVGALAAAVAVVLAVFIHEWPPHEDETLALFVGRSSLPHMLNIVIAQRGGAPLHFFLAWTVVHLGGGLTALRAVSVLFAVASVPAIAVLGSELADRTIGLVAA